MDIPGLDFFNLTEFIAGTVAGGFGLFVGQPFDTVKARMQASRSTFLRSTIKLYRKEHIPGFYRGFFFPLLNTGFNNSVFFGLYGSAMEHLGENRKSKDQLLIDMSIASMFAGFWQTVVACPVDLIKIRQQTDKKKPKMALVVIKDIIKTDGVRGLFKGLVAMCWRDVPGCAAYVIVYEKILQAFSEDVKSRTAFQTCIAGGTAGVVAWLPVIPFDVVKTRIQADTKHEFKGTFHCFKISYRQDGLTGLFRGAQLIAVRAFPVNAAIFLGYEMTRKWIGYWFD